jgi:hypothetical protein
MLENIYEMACGSKIMDEIKAWGLSEASKEV